MTCSDAGKLGAAKRQQLEREPILELARQMRAADKLDPHPGLYPPLLLTREDRLWK